MKLPLKQTQFKRCKATEMRWKRKLVSRISLVTEVMRCPSSDKKSKALELKNPTVSQAIGTNILDLASSEYLMSFLSAALSAAPPACCDVTGRWEAA